MLSTLRACLETYGFIQKRRSYACDISMNRRWSGEPPQQKNLPQPFSFVNVLSPSFLLVSDVSPDHGAAPFYSSLTPNARISKAFNITVRNGNGDFRNTCLFLQWSYFRKGGAYWCFDECELFGSAHVSKCVYRSAKLN